MTSKRFLIRWGLGAAVIVGVVLLIAWWPKGSSEATTVKNVGVMIGDVRRPLAK